MFHNKLQLNKDKTEFMVIASSRMHSRISVDSVNLDGEAIQASRVVRNLGVMMDNTLCMVDHINHIPKTGYYYLNWIRKVRSCLTLEAAKAIAHALIISKIDYCNAILVNLPDYLIRGLQMLMNATARVVTKTSKYDHIIAVLQSLHWLPVAQRIKFKVLSLTFKSLHGESAEYLRDLLHEHVPSRDLRSARKLNLVVPKTKLNYGKRSFSYAAPILWNNLPLEIKLSPTFFSFKRKLKTHLFSEYYE
jgi:hypothetical protein